MATAISYTSESSDHYLSIHPADMSFDQIIESEKKAFDCEWGYLYIQNVASLTLSNDEVKQLTREIVLSIESYEEQ